MKRIFTYAIFILVIVVVFIYKDNIANYITNSIIKQEESDVLLYNDYYLKDDFSYVKNTDAFTVDKKDKIKNIFYTILNSGDDEFSFYCDEEYKSCTKDIKNFFNDKNILANINNFVHPFNSFKNIKLTVTNYGKITINVNHIYTKEQIDFINTEIDKFITDNINDSMDIKEKIKVFHDYVVNNTKFDTEIENSSNKLESNSYTAYGLLKDHLAICGGYADTIAIYLNKLGIKNYRVATDEHVWNLVNIDDLWLHLDSTWDDPVTSDGSDMLMYDYFLIDTNSLLEKDITQHNFDKEVYIEAK